MIAAGAVPLIITDKLDKCTALDKAPQDELIIKIVGSVCYG